MPNPTILQPRPLTAKAFARFGEVIETEFARTIPVNEGLATRFHQLATANISGQGGAAAISIFRTEPLVLPYTVKSLERHPLGSQAFYPLHRIPFLVLVADNAADDQPGELFLFQTNGHQGINFFCDTWHHFLIARMETCDFLVVDRVGTGNNLVEIPMKEEFVIPAV